VLHSSPIRQPSLKKMASENVEKLSNHKVRGDCRKIGDSGFKQISCCADIQVHFENFFSGFSSDDTSFLMWQCATTPLGFIHRHVRYNDTTNQFHTIHAFREASNFKSFQNVFNKKSWSMSAMSMRTTAPFTLEPLEKTCDLSDTDLTSQQIHEKCIEGLDLMCTHPIVDIRSFRSCSVIEEKSTPKPEPVQKVACSKISGSARRPGKFCEKGQI